MGTALQKALELILQGDRELCSILLVTARTSLSSSLLALLLGVPLGIALGSGRFRGRNALLVINRTLMGMPPVVCGLLFYLLFSGVGPLRHMKLLFTVRVMILAQVVLITPIVIGNMESFVASIAPGVWETARGLRVGPVKTSALLANECVYQIFSAYLLAFSRAIAEVGAVGIIVPAQTRFRLGRVKTLPYTHMDGSLLRLHTNERSKSPSNLGSLRTLMSSVIANQRAPLVRNDPNTEELDPPLQLEGLLQTACLQQALEALLSCQVGQLPDHRLQLSIDHVKIRHSGHQLLG